MSISDLCPGYRPNATPAGRCCCGLHWSGVMPPHTEEGRAAPLDRILKRMNKGSEAAVMRVKTRNELDTIGLFYPLPIRPRWVASKVVRS